MSVQYDIMQHPTQHVWDFWYYYDQKEKLFHVLFLNADRSLVATEQHHFSAQLGYGTTKDFIQINWIADDVLCANPSGWDNSSIWSGDVVKTKNGYLLFYTSRNRETDDGFTQNIGAAISQDFIHWERIDDFRLQPDDVIYEPRSVTGDSSIHAWRDPFLFLQDGCPYMLLTAKTKDLPIEKKGVVALLKSQDGGLLHWDILPPVVAPGWYSEMEVTQLFKNPKGGFDIAFSTWAKFDAAPNTQKQGGLQSITLDNPVSSYFPSEKANVLLSEKSGLYAARVIPELGGEIVGFDIAQGGIRRSGVSADLLEVNRSFNDFTVK